MKRNKTHYFVSLFCSLLGKRAEKSSQQKSRTLTRERFVARCSNARRSLERPRRHRTTGRFARPLDAFIRALADRVHFEASFCARTSNDAYVATRFSRSFYPNGDERRRRDLPRRNASAETTTKPTVPYFWSAQSLSVARETRTIRKRPTSFVYVFEAVVGYKKCDEKCRLSPLFFSSFERSLRESFKG